METILWDTPPANLSCSDDEIHIWLARVHSHENNMSFYRSLLSAEDSTNAGRFAREEDRESYMVSRVALKDVVNRYLNAGFETISFFRNEYGKPFIETRINREGMECNLSHSGDMVVIGISRGRDIGVDVERIREMDSMEELINRYFSAIERERFKSLPSGDKTGAFFACWARKEAYIKALGKGLSYSLDSFTVTVDPGGDAALLHDDNGDISEWSLRDIPCPTDYTGAVAVRGKAMICRYYIWDSPRLV